jgi:4'-phosphopantetheinyl transferase
MGEPLGPSDVHVWHRLTGSVSPAEHAAALSRLSNDERERASRFVFDRDRVTFTAAHDLLRHALSHYEDVAPANWRFAATPHGKPVLCDAQAGCRLQFNLSHTSGLVACAVSRGPDVGIDVETVTPADRRTDARDLAARFFSRMEAASLDACGDDERQARFIELWTLKEAYVKALGAGLSHALDTFSFMIPPAGPIHFEPPAGTDPACWQFALYSPSENHRMAVAARRSPGAALTVTTRGQLPWPTAACILTPFDLEP